MMWLDGLELNFVNVWLFQPCLFMVTHSLCYLWIIISLKLEVLLYNLCDDDVLLICIVVYWFPLMPVKLPMYFSPPSPRCGELSAGYIKLACVCLHSSEGDCVSRLTPLMLYSFTPVLSMVGHFLCYGWGEKCGRQNLLLTYLRIQFMLTPLIAAHKSLWHQDTGSGRGYGQKALGHCEHFDCSVCFVDICMCEEFCEVVCWIPER